MPSVSFTEKPSVRVSTTSRAWIAPRARTAVLVLAAIAPAWGCGGDQRPRDASTPPAVQAAEVSVRIDVSAQRAPTVSVLAFQAAAAGVSQRDVLGIVDPLAAAPPERDCELRDVDLSTSALVAHGGSIELQELGGIGIALAAPGASLSPASTVVHPFPRLYPDVATIVGGVVAEAGPLALGAPPERIGLLTSDSELVVEELAVPSPPRILAVNGLPLAVGARVEAADGLSVSVAGGPGTILEVRPFGATVAVACAVAPGAAQESTLVVPRALLVHLWGDTSAGAAAAAGAPLAASLDVVRRAYVRLAQVAPPSRLSVEVRAATAVELRP
jgi:hypothetical protein